MIADDVPCNPRNPRPGSVFHTARELVDIYGDDVEVVAVVVVVAVASVGRSRWITGEMTSTWKHSSEF